MHRVKKSAYWNDRILIQNLNKNIIFCFLLLVTFHRINYGRINVKSVFRIRIQIQGSSGSGFSVKFSVAEPKLFFFGSGSSSDFDHNFGSSYSHILAL